LSLLNIKDSFNTRAYAEIIEHLQYHGPPAISPYTAPVPVDARCPFLQVLKELIGYLHSRCSSHIINDSYASRMESYNILISVTFMSPHAFISPFLLHATRRLSFCPVLPAFEI
jgi:hypothetical protein